MKKKIIILGIFLLIIVISIIMYNKNKITSENHIVINCEKIDKNNNGKLVLVTGELKTMDVVNDYEFDIRTNSAKLYRKVEMYQWKEKCDEKNKCKYSEVWSDKVYDSSKFKKEGYDNPGTKRYESKIFTNEFVKLGVFDIPKELVKQLSTKNRIKDLSKETADLYNLNITSDYYYSTVTNNKPKIGDIRISFYDNNTKKISVLAKQSNNTFKAYKIKRNKILFKIYEK